MACGPQPCGCAAGPLAPAAMARFTVAWGRYSARHRACRGLARGQAARIRAAGSALVRPRGAPASVAGPLAGPGRVAAWAGRTNAARAMAAAATVMTARVPGTAAGRVFASARRSDWLRAGLMGKRGVMAGFLLPGQAEVGEPLRMVSVTVARAASRAVTCRVTARERGAVNRARNRLAPTGRTRACCQVLPPLKDTRAWTPVIFDGAASCRCATVMPSTCGPGLVAPARLSPANW